jgi:hypothetical protein
VCVYAEGFLSTCETVAIVYGVPFETVQLPDSIPLLSLAETCQTSGRDQAQLKMLHFLPALTVAKLPV